MGSRNADVNELKLLRKFYQWMLCLLFISHFFAECALREEVGKQNVMFSVDQEILR